MHFLFSILYQIKHLQFLVKSSRTFPPRRIRICRINRKNSNIFESHIASIWESRSHAALRTILEEHFAKSSLLLENTGSMELSLFVLGLVIGLGGYTSKT